MQTKAIWVLAGAVGGVGLGASAAFATVTAPLDSVVPAAPLAHSSLTSHSLLLDLATTDGAKATIRAAVPAPVVVAPAAPVEAAPVVADPAVVPDVVVAPVADPTTDPDSDDAVKDPSKDCDHDGIADAAKVAAAMDKDAAKDKDNDGAKHADGSHAPNGHAYGWHGAFSHHSNGRGGHK